MSKAASDYHPPALATLEAFLSLDVRIGTVIAAERRRGAVRPSLALRVDFGRDWGPRAAYAEIAEPYEPNDMIGLQVAAVVNLPARRIEGQDFDAVVLAVANLLGERTLLIPERPVPDGARIAP